MTRRSDHERLLADALADDMPAEFREALLSDTLQRVRWRKRRRPLQRGALALVCLAMLGLLVKLILPRETLRVDVTQPGYRLVRTQPLPAAFIVVSTPWVPDPFAGFVPIVNVVETDAHRSYDEMSDAELLALVAPRQGALIGCGPSCAQLVFANPGDEQGFPLN
jgi:hypothetical protein